MPHFTEDTHPKFEEKQERWNFAKDHYTGEYADFDNNQQYLHRKEQRESQKAYRNRREDSDPVLLFPTAVDSLNGIVSGNENDIKRDWGELATYDDDGNLKADSIAYTLIHNADGEGTNWDPLFKQVGIKQTIYHTVWGLVEGVETDEQGNTLKEAHVKVIDPQSVVNWFPSTGMPTQVLVKEQRDNRESIRDDKNDADGDVYTLYELEGWTRFKIKEDDDGNKYEEVIGQGEYEYYNDTDRTTRILPIFQVEIPMPRDVGYLLAKKQNHIYNKKSSRDWGVQIMSFALLMLAAENKQYENILDALEKGANAIQLDPDASNQHQYISPPSDYLTEAGEILEKDKKDFYEAAFKQYGDAAKQVTATEIRLESRSGIEAFLSLLVTSIDEFENNCLWRIMQVYFPDNPSAWGSANVERSQEFQPQDIKELMESLSSSVLNADRSNAMSTKTKVETLHPEWSEEEVEEEVERINNERGAVELPDNQVGA